jgi:hypothetical protein
MKTEIRQKFIVGNWKMHTTSFEAQQLAKGIVDGFAAPTTSQLSSARRSPIFRSLETCLGVARSRSARRMFTRKPKAPSPAR